MKNVVRVLSAVTFCVLLSVSAVAQQPVPPPPQPAADGPSLAATLQFIQDMLNENAKITIIVFHRDANNGNTWTGTMTNETSNVVADPSRCRISYHRKEGSVGNTGTDQNYEFSLREVRQVVVLPYAQANNEWNAKNGHPNNITTSTNPPATELSVRRPHGEENCFYFTDEALANRLAKAFTHAAELCGGGNKDPF